MYYIYFPSSIQCPCSCSLYMHVYNLFSSIAHACNYEDDYITAVVYKLLTLLVYLFKNKIIPDIAEILISVVFR